jgi:hypothetical protein
MNKEKNMSIKNKLGQVAAMGVAAFAIVGLSAPTVASAATPGPSTCAFQTVNTRNFVTAVGAGGRTTDVIHTDATGVGSWERFTLVPVGDGVHYGLRTSNGHYLTAVGGGGRSTDAIHSDATSLRDWEKFTVVRWGGDGYAIQTIDGHYLTAVGGGGRTSDTIHSNATAVNSWELFFRNCS